ncbi:hypothetical protein CUC43_30465 [Bacillus thuringiensis LM1212]|uniref:Spermidine/putrescine ABC transporter ATP-binding protein n=1 Tax=Bacillus tropicus TaxID=2026188 RepID=A0A4Y6F5V0_9BACI|nr:hypothetical protein CUC43_30465 [Bacillus thuringiensis LM1212]KAA0805381.1 hypothetical protein DN398_07710 [Bacillus sp. JAS102]PDY92510.1 hypothetical protein CON09_09650 [Bacillus anthracis]QDF23689.1 hypothetical protein FJR70_11945 [Bacillus tropicus]TXR83281.1 hypothetical protein DN396_08705 [Bacillus sp. BF9-10]
MRSFLRFFSNSCTSPSKRNFEIYPALTGSKTPTSKFSGSKEVRRESTARKCPIGSTNNQRGMPPTD